MTQVLGLHPFVPSRDFEVSKRFYKALGFSASFEDAKISILGLDGFSFILQNFYQKEFAENCMLQLVVRDVDAWWERVDALEGFDVRAPLAPAMQDWGMKVGFLFDPTGVLWHVAQSMP